MKHGFCRLATLSLFADVHKTDTIRYILSSAGIFSGDHNSQTDALQQHVVYCQGQALQDLDITFEEASLTEGQTLSVELRCTSYFVVTQAC